MLTIKLFRGWENPGLFVAKLQVTLHSTRGVLGTLTVIAMRQRQYQARTLQPLHFSGSNELIDDALSIVGKVAKLCFPYDKSIGRR